MPLMSAAARSCSEKRHKGGVFYGAITITSSTRSRLCASADRSFSREVVEMSVQLNHTIVFSRDKRAAAAFLTGILGLPPATLFGPFLAVQMTNDITLDFYDADREIVPQHYAF